MLNAKVCSDYSNTTTAVPSELQIMKPLRRCGVCVLVVERSPACDQCGLSLLTAKWPKGSNHSVTSSLISNQKKRSSQVIDIYLEYTSNYLQKYYGLLKFYFLISSFTGKTHGSCMIIVVFFFWLPQVTPMPVFSFSLKWHQIHQEINMCFKSFILTLFFAPLPQAGQ